MILLLTSCINNSQQFSSSWWQGHDLVPSCSQLRGRGTCTVTMLFRKWNFKVLFFVLNCIYMSVIQAALPPSKIMCCKKHMHKIAGYHRTAYHVLWLKLRNHQTILSFPSPSLRNRRKKGKKTLIYTLVGVR